MAGSPPEDTRQGRRYERVFVVRVWEEAGASTRDGPRGSIHELASGRRFFFSGLRDLHDFLSVRLSGEDCCE
ncbi:MAG TPA: hypothetical protein VFF63_00780 [Candidatus Babeliales bacterium]|nr:hypothetical protein [Candidatus Babeliales bacterium]